MEHYKNLMSALAGAMPVCMTWILAGTEDNYFNARDVFAFALSEGGEDEEMGEDQFYVVSDEGAIGLSVKYEYLTRWMFIPVFGEERERELARLREELEYDREHENDEADENEYSEDASGDGYSESAEDDGYPEGENTAYDVADDGFETPDVEQPHTPEPHQEIPSPQQQNMMYSQGAPYQQPMPPQGAPYQQPQMPSQGNQQAGKKRFCMQCGFQLNANSKFCPKCGTPAQR